MTVIQPNGIAGIVSITAQSNSIQFYKSDGILAGLNLDGVNFNTTSGISTLSSLNIGTSISISSGVVTAISAKFNGTGAVGLTTGTTAQRPASPDAGMIRYNNETQQFEGYSTAWGGFGGASGASGDQIFYENDQEVTASYEITTGKNAMSAGPVGIATGVTVTIPSGSTWTIV